MALSNKEIPTDLREYIEINILPQYATFDKAHRLNHAEKVIEESMKLAQYYEVEPAMVYTIAAYHDLGLCEGREFHHLISGKILAADEKLRKWFSEAQLQTMKEPWKTIVRQTNRLLEVCMGKLWQKPTGLSIPR